MSRIRGSLPNTLIVATEDLCCGMFVAELDRPWLGTPFLLQGFHLEEPAQLAQLRELCRFVRVDPRRSKGVDFSMLPRSSERSQALRLLPAFIHDEVQRARLDFMGFLRRLRRRGKGGEDDLAPDLANALREAKALAADGGEVPLELEMLASAAAFDAAEQAVAQVLQDIEAGCAINLQQAEGAVREMVSSVMRNPDALMWMARLRSGNEEVYQRALDASVHLMVFGNSVGMREAELQLLGMAGLVLDVGRLRLPAEIQDKPGVFTPEDMAQVKRHVDHSITILQESIDTDPALIDLVSRHHERRDGSGYPRGLAGDAIGLHGEMAGIVDAYCAMTRPRLYAPVFSSHQALDILLKEEGRLFASHAVDQFVQCVGIYPVGSLLELHTGEVAVVVAQNRVRRLKPRVMVLLQADKTTQNYPVILDLLYEPKAPDGTSYRVLRGLPPDAYGIDPQEFYLA